MSMGTEMSVRLMSRLLFLSLHSKFHIHIWNIFHDTSPPQASVIASIAKQIGDLTLRRVSKRAHNPMLWASCKLCPLAVFRRPLNPDQDPRLLLGHWLWTSQATHTRLSYQCDRKWCFSLSLCPVWRRAGCEVGAGSGRRPWTRQSESQALTGAAAVYTFQPVSVLPSSCTHKTL